MSTVYSPTGHLAHLHISDRENMNDERYGVDAAKRAVMLKCYNHAHDGLASGAKYISKQVERYPNDPVFLNYLGTWHDFRGEAEQTTAILERTYERFPDYLFANVSMANLSIARERPEEVFQYLGPGLRIEERFPDREEFHINEIEGYESACLKYLIVTHKLDEAKERLNALRSVSDDTEWLDELELGITMGLVAKRLEEEKVQMEGMPKMEFETQPESLHADRELVLQHAQLRMLFERALDLKPEELREILALPRESLVRDLGAIVQHSIDRFRHYKENEDDLWNDQLSFVHHALLLLGELHGPDSLEIMLHALSQSLEYLDLYLGDWLTESVWEPLMKQAEGQLDGLDAFMRRPHLHAFSKVVVSEAVSQLGMHKPELMHAIEQWYAGLLAFYNAASPDDEVMDATQLGLMVGDILDLGLVSLLPAVEALYARGAVPSSVCGNIDEVRAKFAEGTTGKFRRDILGIEARYAELAELERDMDEQYEGEEEGAYNDGFDDAPLVHLPVRRAAPKVGRNDPCPCGSGKKYKKCCEGKGSMVPAGLPMPHY